MYDSQNVRVKCSFEIQFDEVTEISLNLFVGSPLSPFRHQLFLRHKPCYSSPSIMSLGGVGRVYCPGPYTERVQRVLVRHHLCRYVLGPVESSFLNDGSIPLTPVTTRRSTVEEVPVGVDGSQRNGFQNGKSPFGV